jgi:hypothetical protein
VAGKRDLDRARTYSTAAHPDPVGRNPPGDEVLARAVRDGDEEAIAVQGRDQALGGPHSGRDGPRYLLEGHLSKEVVTQGENRDARVEGRVEGDLVEALDHDIESTPAGVHHAHPCNARVVGREASEAAYVEAVHPLAGRSARKARRGEGDGVSPSGEAAEDLGDVDLRATGGRV